MMEELMTYKSVYDETVLQVFGNFRDSIENLKLTSDYVVSIRKIVNLCKIKIRYLEDEIETDCNIYNSASTKLKKKPESDSRHRIIWISAFDSDARQRFDIASNLFLILNPFFEKEISERYKDLKEVEVHNLALLTANNFAADLLMPRKLVVNALVKAMRLLNYDAKENFSEMDIDLVANRAAKIMHVPSDSFKYRLTVLGLFR